MHYVTCDTMEELKKHHKAGHKIQIKVHGLPTKWVDQSDPSWSLKPEDYRVVLLEVPKEQQTQVKTLLKG